MTRVSSLIFHGVDVDLGRYLDYKHCLVIASDPAEKLFHVFIEDYCIKTVKRLDLLHLGRPVEHDADLYSYKLENWMLEIEPAQRHFVMFFDAFHELGALFFNGLGIGDLQRYRILIDEGRNEVCDLTQWWCEQSAGRRDLMNVWERLKIDEDAKLRLAGIFSE